MTSRLQFDTTGLTLIDDMLWRDGRGDHVLLKVFDVVPDLPAPLTDMATVGRQVAIDCANEGCTLVDCESVELDGLPALRMVVKVRKPDGQTGCVFQGSLLVPRATASAVLLAHCVEDGVTGVREAVTMSQTGPDQFYRPSPYAPDVDLVALGALPTNVADLPERDANFPDHPLTRVRVLLNRLANSIEASSAFRAMAPFAS